MLFGTSSTQHYCHVDCHYGFDSNAFHTRNRGNCRAPYMRLCCGRSPAHGVMGGRCIGDGDDNFGVGHFCRDDCKDEINVSN